MSRPTKEQVDAACEYAKAWDFMDDAEGVLYREVLALRAELDRPENERVKQLKIAQASIDSLEREVRALRAIDGKVERVEALVEGYEAFLRDAMPDSNIHVICTYRQVVDEMNAALKGEL
jgi:hypothetical protein